MKRRSCLLPFRAALFCAFLFSLSCGAPAKLRKTPETSGVGIRAQIDAILADSSLAQTRVGIQVVSLRTGRVLYDRDSNLLFNPASNMKLLTTATALSRLGPDFRFKTELRADTASVADSAIAGNLYLKGYADPDLSLADLDWLIQRLRNKGIRRISGDLVCDASYLDDFFFGAGWMWDDASSSDFAPIAALTVNDNCVTVTVQPGAQVGDSLSYLLEPETAYVKIQNLGVTVDSLDSNRIRRFKVEREWKRPSNTIVIEGGLPAGTAERQLVIEVVNPVRFMGTVFSEMLARAGIELPGQVTEGTLPDTSLSLVTHISAPLSEVIRNTNKISDNLSAELLLKTLGAEFRRPPGSAKAGLAVVKEFLSEVGIDTTKLYLADGSGVSRYDVVTPAQVVKLLRHMAEDFHVQAEFMASLPIAGMDGTLRNRMLDTPAQGKLRAKTGTLRGVSSLSGYTTTADGEPLAFSIMMEHFVGPASLRRSLQDRICAVISGSAARVRP